MAGKLISPRTFQCGSCGANLQISAAGYSSVIICSRCFSTTDVTHPLPKLIKKYQGAMNEIPEIPLGSFGVIKNIKWKVIGFMVRKDPDYEFSWNEYLLFNPYHGFRFLLQIESHFSLTQTLDYNPIPNTGLTSEFELPGTSGNFKIFNRGNAVVTFVVGEFYWQARTGEKVSMEDFINPPFMFSIEKNREEITTSLSEYVDFSEIQEAFKHIPDLNLSIPWKASANKPNPYHKSYKTIMSIWGYSALAIILAWMFFSVSKKESMVNAFELNETHFNNAQKEYISPAFDLTDSYGNIELALNSNVNNQWLSTNVTLVNETTGEEYTGETGVEYYTGYDSDGYWSEGSQSNEQLLSGIPGGKYHAEISAESDSSAKTFRLKIMRNGSMWINFWLALLGVSIYPLWVMWNYRLFEKSRWYDSDFSPYAVSESLSSSWSSSDYGDYDDD